ncbi:hypothetical protein ACQK5W_00550 [Pantoea sp. FN060301]|uniref:hypothetical protein n=1 Tax=Pantoea sp. FN060301 TaxID=3420380 RepID=UPI003D17583A
MSAFRSKWTVSARMFIFCHNQIWLILSLHPTNPQAASGLKALSAFPLQRSGRQPKRKGSKLAILVLTSQLRLMSQRDVMVNHVTHDAFIWPSFLHSFSAAGTLRTQLYLLNSPMLKTLRFIIPLLALAGAIAYWLMPHHSAEEESYYRSVFCTIDHSDPQEFLRDMEKVVESGNSGYALRQYHYIPELGERMLSTWQKLSAQDKAAISEDQQQCLEIMSEKQR